MADLTIPARARSRLGLSLPLLFGLLVYAVTVVRAKQILGDPDTYWHIVLGNWILAHHAVPHRDLWSYTKAGAPFTPMEWLSEVVIAGIYNIFGWAGLAAMAALSVASALALLVRLLLRHLLPIHAAIAAALAWSMVLGHILARPHILSLPILVVWSAALVAARGEERAPSFWLVPLMTLWANLHASYLFGLGLSALFAGEAVLAAGDWPARFRAARLWGLFCLLALLAALVNPYGLSGLLQPLKLLRMHFALAVLTEWQSPNFEYFQPLEVWVMVLVAAAFTFAWRLPWTRLVMVLFLLHMALAHARNVEVLGLVAPLLLAPALSYQLEDRPGEGRILAFLDRNMAELAKPASAIGVVVAGLLFLSMSGAALLPRRISHESNDITPAAALAAAAAHHVKGHILNDYGFGGYLIFRGIKTFIDGRADFYGDAFIKRYYRAVTLTGGDLPQLLDHYGITWTLLPPKEPAVRLLAHLPGWRQIYADKVAVVDVREGALSH
jgi:hypothetical protein